MAPATADTVTCELWIDGAKVPDQPVDVGRLPAALAGLAVTWGRTDTESQPEPATCSFVVVGPDGGTAATDLVHGGVHVNVYARSPDTLPARSWTATPGAWSVQTGAWQDQPAGATLVFAGRVTDTEVADDLDGVAVTAMAVDVTAEYGHRYIGDEPWPAETAQQRGIRITGLAQIPTIQWPGARATTPISRRDVDHASAYELLTNLATSTGCVLWLDVGPAGQRLWMDDPTTRVALLTLSLVGGVVVIVPATGQPGQIDLTACAVDAEPARLRQDTDLIVSTVEVTWLDQSTVPDPTERTVSQTDAIALRDYGTRRLGLSTEVADGIVATDLATRRLARLATADWMADEITWNLVDGGDADAALNLLDAHQRIAAPLSLSDLPPWSPVGGGLTCWIEGGAYTYGATGWSLVLVLSPASTGGKSVAWSALPAAWKWNQFDPTILWRDLWGVGYAA